MNTFVSIDCDEFMSFKNEELFMHIFPENLIKVAGTIAGKGKMQTLNNLTKGQKSLWMFFTIYSHNVLGWNLFFYAFSDEIYPSYIEELKSGLEYIGDKKLLSLVICCEKIYNSPNDTQKKQRLFEPLDQEYEILKKESLKNAGDFVRHHPGEFVVFQKKDL